jgi:cardiolipin synthase
MSWTRHHNTERAAPDSSFGMRRRIAIAFGVLLTLQAIVAAIVTYRNRRALIERAERRPHAFPAMDFSRLALEKRADTVTLYMDGASLLRDIINAIDDADDRILIETFIWVDDASGRAIRDALVRAARRGVRVFVLWDWALSDRSIQDGFFPNEIEAYPFKPLRWSPASLRPRNIIRDHRKIVVVDDRRAFVGGFNFGDEYLAWRDTHLRVTGLGALEIANAFVDFWNQHVPSRATRLHNIVGRSWDPHFLVHRNDPSLAIFPIRGMYLEAMDRASERIWMTNAYFVPDRTFRSAMCAAARRGVDVRVMLPARSNHPLTDVLAHGMFDDLLVAGVRIFLYRDFMVHAKTAVIDSSWVTIGTANLDRWSMLGNYEINLEIRSEQLAEQTAEMFEFDMRQCDEIHLEGWKRRPVTWRASERVLGTLAPFM